MTFRRKPFRRSDFWSNVTFDGYNISSTTTFGRISQLVENSSKYVKIWLKIDLYTKIVLHAFYLQLQFRFGLCLINKQV